MELSYSDCLKLIEMPVCYFPVWNPGIYFPFSLEFWEEKGHYITIVHEHFAKCRKHIIIYDK